MIRMETACFLAIAFMAYFFFAAKRENTKLRQVFSRFLVFSLFHLITDAVTIYTVNHLETVPLWLNDLFHKLFIVSMIAVFTLVYQYILLLIEEEMENEISMKIPRWSMFMIIGTLIGAVFLPITYTITPKGNYGSGPAAYMAYAGIAISLFSVLYILIRYRGKIKGKKRKMIEVAFIIELGVSLYQFFYPLALVSGMGIMLITLAFYLIMENPDRSLIKEVEAEKRKAEAANVAKSQFLSNMSHEIRTPMNAIIGMTDIMLGTQLSEKQKEYLTNIKSSGTALVAIINDILDISKIEAGKMELVEEPYEIEPLIRDVRMIVQSRIGDKPIKYEGSLDDRLPKYVYGDSVRIRQVIINLANNAVKFTEKGKIHLSLKVLDLKEDVVKVRISVKDTGQGIKEEDFERLFDAFEQVDIKKNIGKEGTGLGLAICKQLIEMMGGHLDVKSEYGKGSEFSFVINQKIIKERDFAKEEKKCIRFIAPEAKILLVDDNEMNRIVAEALLEPLQVQLDFAEDGKQAVEMVQKKEYDIVFMDHMMPVMDGVEATKEIRGLDGDYYQNLPIVALTANVMKESRDLFKEAGMDDIVGKPIETDQINRAVWKWLPTERVIDENDMKKGEEEEKEKKDERETEIKTETSEEEQTYQEISNIEGIDIDAAIKNCGNLKFLLNIIEKFHTIIETKATFIEECVEKNKIKEYTIEVHALKNNARLVGALELGEEFYKLEKYGSAKDIESIKKETDEVLAHYRLYKERFAPYGKNDNTKQEEKTKKEGSKEELHMYLKGIQDAMQVFDIDLADEAMGQLEEYQMPSEAKEWMEQLQVAIADVNAKEAIRIAGEMIKLIQED